MGLYLCRLSIPAHGQLLFSVFGSWAVRLRFRPLKWFLYLLYFVVTRDVPDNAIVVGVPAKTLNYKSSKALVHFRGE